MLGRVIRDIGRQIDGKLELEARFAHLLDLATTVRLQDHRQRGPKVYALHAPDAFTPTRAIAATSIPTSSRLDQRPGPPRHRRHSPRDEAPRCLEPVIGHVKTEHRMERNYLKGREGDRINAVLAAAGYNFSQLLRWLEVRSTRPEWRQTALRAAK